MEHQGGLTAIALHATKLHLTI